MKQRESTVADWAVKLMFYFRWPRDTYHYAVSCISSPLKTERFFLQYILHETSRFVNRCVNNYEQYKFRVFANDFIQFLQRPLSSQFIVSFPFFFPNVLSYFSCMPKSRRTGEISLRSTT